MYNIASISLFILFSAQLPRTLNLILENNLVSFEYFSFWLWTELKVCKFDIDFYYYFCLNSISFCACFVILFVLILFIFCVKNWLFYVHFFSLSFFSSKIFNFTDVLFSYVLAHRQFRYPTSLQVPCTARCSYGWESGVNGLKSCILAISWNLIIILKNTLKQWVFKSTIFWQLP